MTTRSMIRSVDSGKRSLRAAGLPFAARDLELAMEEDYPELRFYGPDLLTAIGVVTIRAGHLDDYLVFLMALAGGMAQHRARAAFFSTTSAKARLDMIRALVLASEFSTARRNHALKLLDRAKSVADRRNELIHDQYMMAGDKPVRIKERPAYPKKRRNTLPVDMAAIRQLAADYWSLRQALWDFYVDVTIPKSAGLPSRGTPD